MNVQARPVTDPIRAKVEQRAAHFRLKMVEVGPMIGRSRSYMHNYLRRNDPPVLPDEVRAKLATILRLPERELCAPGQVTSEGLRVGAPAMTFSTTTEQITAPPVVAGQPSVPLFDEDADIEPNAARQWVPSPSNVPVVGGMFALLIHTDTPRARAGDTVYVAHRRPRTGDMAVALQGTRVVAVGEIAALDADTATFLVQDGAKQVPLDGHRILKVTTIATG